MTDTTIRHIATVFPVSAEALKPERKFHRRRSIIREFSLNTSTHGIPGIARSETTYNRIFWTISLLIFTGIMIYFITESLRAYFSYPTQTSVSVVVERLQPFPAVSICNYSPLRYDTFIVPFLNYTNSRNLTNITDTSTFSWTQALYIRDFFQYVFNEQQPVFEYLFPLNPMLIMCSYNGKACGATDFIPFVSSAYGRCYTFNAKMKLNDSSVRYTTDYGGSGKLELRLYAHSHQYVPYVSDDVSAGMMAMIHDNTELPLIEGAGIQLAPGRKHKLSYQKRIHQLLPSPYSECTNKIPLIMHAMYDRYEGADYAYSSVICYMLCVQTYVYQECNCVNPYQWTARSIVLPGTDKIINASLCNITDDCYSDATNRITNTASIWDQYCSDCSEACSTVDFIITPSSVAAPSLEYIYRYRSFVENSGVNLSSTWSTTWQSDIQKNYVALEVVSETTRVETYTAEASVSWVDVVSNVGGHTGLWIGISFLSLMELVEMLYRLIRYHCHTLIRRIRYNNDEQL